MEPDPNKSKKEIFKLIVIIIIILVILGSFILYVSFPLLGKDSVILATRPVDPFDPIRGQYMIINYEINTIPKIDQAKVGDTVYVVIDQDENRISRYKKASLYKPKKSIFIKGEIKSIRNEDMQIEYGIEQYFFERRAKFETRIQNVEVRLSDTGRAIITKLLDKNKEEVKIEYEEIKITS